MSASIRSGSGSVTVCRAAGQEVQILIGTSNGGNDPDVVCLPPAAAVALAEELLRLSRNLENS